MLLCMFANQFNSAVLHSLSDSRIIDGLELEQLKTSFRIFIWASTYCNLPMAQVIDSFGGTSCIRF